MVGEGLPEYFCGLGPYSLQWQNQGWLWGDGVPFSEVPGKGGRGEGRRKGRKTKISLSVVELALTASPSKAWDGARFGPQAGKELRPGQAKPGRMPQTYMCLPPAPRHTISDLCFHLPAHLCPFITAAVFPTISWCF